MQREEHDRPRSTPGASSFEAAKPTIEEWRRVVRAIEISLPIYDTVSEKISLNRAVDARRVAAEHLVPARKGWVVDVGVGPGVSTRILLDEGFESIVGLDPSIALLKHTRQVFPRDRFNPVRAVSEHLPFRKDSVDGLLTCFALRDVLDPELSLKEFSRVLREHGRFGIVDVGKPGNVLERFFVSTYVRIGMPVVSSVLSWRRVEGNPFRMIVPTYDRLVPNKILVEGTRRAFGTGELRSIMFGGLIVLTGERLGKDSPSGYARNDATVSKFSRVASTQCP